MLISPRRQDQLLNSTYSQSGFTLDEGEQLLQDLRDDLSHYCQVVEALYESSLEVVPLKRRGSPLQKPVAAKCICIYKQDEVRRCHHLLFRYFYSIFPYLVISLLRSISARMQSLIWSVIFRQ
jgi:hypothetical protein